MTHSAMLGYWALSMIGVLVTFMMGMWLGFVLGKDAAERDRQLDRTWKRAHP